MIKRNEVFLLIIGVFVCLGYRRRIAEWIKEKLWGRGDAVRGV